MLRPQTTSLRRAITDEYGIWSSVEDRCFGIEDRCEVILLALTGVGEFCGIDLHSSGIQQREERSGTTLGECALCLMCQQLQRVDSDEGDAIAEAEALGKRSPDAQSRVATRACTHGDS